MKKIAFLVAAASLFAVAPLANRFGPVVSSAALVWLAVMLAVCASGAINSLGVASGALGAFGSGILAAISPAAAGAVLLGAAFAERTTRVRSRTARGVHVLLAVVGGALAGSCSHAFAGSSYAVMGVSIVVAAVLSALPLLVEADDPVAHALEVAARDVSEPAKTHLASGAELRRSSVEIPLDRQTDSKVKTTWKSLLRLGEARVRLERNRPRIRVATEGTALTPQDQVLGMVDQRIGDTVAALEKALSAVDTAHAAAIGIDRSALEHVDSLGESMNEVSRALVEVDGPTTARMEKAAT